MRVSTTSHRVMIVHLCRTTHFFLIGVCTEQFVTVGANLFFQWIKLPGLAVAMQVVVAERLLRWIVVLTLATYCIFFTNDDKAGCVRPSIELVSR